MKDQKNTPRTRQLHENNIEVLTQKPVINGDISWSAGVVKSQNNLSETVTIVNKSTASYQQSNIVKDRNQKTRKAMKAILMKSLLKVWRRSSWKTVIFNQNDNDFLLLGVTP